MKLVEVTWHKNTKTDPYELRVQGKCGHEEPRTIEVKYKPLPTRARDAPIDVSSPIGLFQIDSPISAEENERLERCLSDLLLWVIQPHLESCPPCVLLIEGSPLNKRPVNKLIGRLGYRFPRSELTIAFVTINTDVQHAASSPSQAGVHWQGPIPPFNEDSIIRTYFQDRESYTVRVDLFAQGLSKYSVDEEQDSIPYGVGAKLRHAEKSILKFAATLQRSPLPTESTAQSSSSRHLASFKENDGAERAPVLEKKAAKKTPPTIYRPKDSQLVSPDCRATPGEQLSELSDKELFNAYADQRTSTEPGKQRFEIWRKFIQDNDIHDKGDKIGFLKFVDATLQHNRYAKKYEYTLKDLIRWYEEYHQGDAHGTKR